MCNWTSIINMTLETKLFAMLTVLPVDILGILRHLKSFPSQLKKVYTELSQYANGVQASPLMHNIAVKNNNSLTIMFNVVVWIVLTQVVLDTK